MRYPPGMWIRALSAALLLLAGAAVAQAKPDERPSPADTRFTELERELRRTWEAARQQAGNDPQRIDRVQREHGARLVRAWRDYLARFPDGPRTFEAKNFLLQGYVFAREEKPASALLDDMERDARTATRIAMVASGRYFLHRDTRAARAVIERFVTRTKSRREQAEALLAMRSFVDGTPREAEAARLKIAHRVLRDYADTPAGARAKRLVRAAGLRPGHAPIALDRFRDTAGRALRLDELRGRVVVLHFWVSRSPASLASLELLDRLMDGDDDPVVIAVNCDTDRTAFALATANLRGKSWRHYFDGRGERNRVAAEYGIEHLPQALVIGRDGRLAATGHAGENAIGAIKAALAAPRDGESR